MSAARSSKLKQSQSVSHRGPRRYARRRHSPSIISQSILNNNDRRREGPSNNDIRSTDYVFLHRPMLS